ncbi:hypothetical protein ACENVV_003448 [Vibrio cholerae]|uniref:hypothetical protein n=1 Tax=Vibrio cholerae TaxID=666 RepID=UPI0029AB0C63|nr:hypothetical protein [Vibrio cholerae]ELV3250095.1 hypothetical protein [Vibrio cholerae]
MKILIYLIVFLLYPCLSNANETFISGVLNKSNDDRYSVYTKDLRDFITNDIPGGEYRVFVDNVSEKITNGSLVSKNSLSFYYCSISSDTCLLLENNRPLSVSYNNMIDLKIKVVSSNVGYVAGSYTESFTLFIDKKL